MGTEIRVFRELRSVLVESIFWDARTRELAWVDITAGTFHRASLDGARDGSHDRVVDLPAPVSAVQPALEGGYIAALKNRVVRLDDTGAIVAELATVAHAHGGIRFNEGKVDPFGRFLVGAMDVTSDDPDAGLYLVDAAGARVLQGGFGVANGFEWNDDGSEAFVTDTSTKTVYRAPYGPGSEPLGELRPFLTGHASDGLVRDGAGAFWNAVYGGAEVLRWSADGVLLSRIPLPAPNITSVALGGPDLRTLFIGSARENLTEENLEAAPLSGSIFCLDVEVAGLPVGTYGAASLAVDERNE